MVLYVRVRDGGSVVVDDCLNQSYTGYCYLLSINGFILLFISVSNEL
jgi:hypothetical protein